MAAKKSPRGATKLNSKLADKVKLTTLALQRIALHSQSAPVLPAPLSPIANKPTTSVDDAAADEEPHIAGLLSSCHESEKAREEAGAAIEALSLDFHRDFSPNDNPYRRPARALIIKASHTITRLQETNKSLESSANQCVNKLQLTTREKEVMISALQAEVRRLDFEFISMQRQVENHRVYVDGGVSALKAVLLKALSDADGELDNARSKIGVSHELLVDTKAALEQRDQRLAMTLNANAQLEEERDEARRQLDLELEAHRRDQARAQDEVDKLTAENNMLNGVVDELKSCVKRLRSAEAEGANLRKHAAAAADKIGVLDENVTEMKQRVRDAERAVEEKDARIRELESELREASSHVHEARESLKHKESITGLQAVLRDAMRATSWQQCRQLLYHESLRYVERLGR